MPKKSRERSDREEQMRICGHVNDPATFYGRTDYQPPELAGPKKLVADGNVFYITIERQPRPPTGGGGIEQHRLGEND